MITWLTTAQAMLAIFATALAIVAIWWQLGPAVEALFADAARPIDA
jgi:hypothetical protein